MLIFMLLKLPKLINSNNKDNLDNSYLNFIKRIMPFDPNFISLKTIKKKVF